MSAKKIYLVVKTTFRDNKILFRETLCVCSSLKRAVERLAGVVKSESLEDCVKVRIGSFRDWVLITKYRDADLVNGYEDRFFYIFTMQMDAFGDEKTQIPLYAFEYLKQEIYGNK